MSQENLAERNLGLSISQRLFKPGMNVKRKKRVLFICTHNSARSQMAEGVINKLYGQGYEAYSAGTNPTAVNPYAIKVMAEIGIDISQNRSKSIDEFEGVDLDYVITVCDDVRENCPTFPGGKIHIHESFLDPSSFNGSVEKKVEVFRQVRDQIKDWIAKTFSSNVKNL